eukprot:gene11293-18929_t
MGAEQSAQATGAHPHARLPDADDDASSSVSLESSDSSGLPSSNPLGKSEGSEEPCTHHFDNTSSSLTVAALWVDYKGEEQQYHLLEPGYAAPQLFFGSNKFALHVESDVKLFSVQNL